MNTIIQQRDILCQIFRFLDDHTNARLVSKSWLHVSNLVIGKLSTELENTLSLINLKNKFTKKLDTLSEEETPYKEYRKVKEITLKLNDIISNLKLNRFKTPENTQVKFISINRPNEIIPCAIGLNNLQNSAVFQFFKLLLSQDIELQTAFFKSNPSNFFDNISDDKILTLDTWIKTNNSLSETSFLKLDLESSKLLTFPNSFDNLQNLHLLNYSTSLCLFPNTPLLQLESLTFETSEIKEHSESLVKLIQMCSSLKNLTFWGCDLDQIPDFIYSLNQLKALTFYVTPLTKFPREFIQKSTLSHLQFPCIEDCNEKFPMSLVSKHKHRGCFLYHFKKDSQIHTS
jgi:hypothetical protein